MNILEIPISECRLGDILSKDIAIHKGTTLVTKNTILDECLLKLLWDWGINKIWIYSNYSLEISNVNKDMLFGIDESYKASMTAFEVILKDLTSKKDFSYEDLEKLTLSIYENIDNEERIIKYLHSPKTYDNYLLSHSVNVSYYAMLIGKWLGMSNKLILDLITAGLFHDIGKLKIPQYILSKTRALTTKEFEIIKQHVSFGYDMVKDIKHLDSNIKESILMHHERLDGSGYPNGIDGEGIGEYARIIAIADVYDAMTSDRVYREKISPQKTLQMFLESRGITYDKYYLNIFLSNLVTQLLNTSDKFMPEIGNITINTLTNNTVRL